MSNVVLDNFVTGLNIEHDQTIAFIPTDLKVTNVTFSNITNLSKGKNTLGTTVDVSNSYTETTTATGAGNGTGVPTWALGWTTGL